MAERLCIPSESRDRNAVQDLSGGDAADLESEIARGCVEGERLRPVDREWAASAGPVQRADHLHNLVCGGARNVEIRVTDAAEIHVFAIEAHNGVVCP